ncbi:sulfatase [Halosquirtibacter xylanolyticus]|uniref:sulfatase family protein n=1 Tax=Halosquirtibacter xylanolyticus TaxID=3374599 RepID=UPI00374923A2|nr:sulfatase [Prolixibacteraceae bacterium]
MNLTKKSIIATFLMATGAYQSFAKEKEERPNIIFLLTDDQSYQAVGCLGNNEIQTPNIDKIGQKGIIFTQYYNTTAICMASRATIMTGMYENKTGCNFSHGAMTPDKFEKSYPMLLKRAGYKVGFAGKFGYAIKGGKNSKFCGYHEYKDLPVDKFDWWRGWPGQGDYKTEKNKYMIPYAKKYPHVSGALGAAAIEFLEDYGNKKEPFCLSVSFKAPHGPMSPDKKYNHVYANKTFTKKENYWKENGEHLAKQSKQGRQYKRINDTWSPAQYDKKLAKYYQQIYGVDKAVGMILDQLKSQGLDKNTIIIFTSDNGYHCGAHGFGGKVLTYEEGSRAPLLAYVPGAKGNGKHCGALVSNVDIAPTILNAAGVKIPSNMDGVSLSPLFSNPTREVKDHEILIQVWGENPTHCLSLVADGYKYFYWFYGEGMEPTEELFNLNDDPYEMHNIVNETSAKRQLIKMRKLYDNEVSVWSRNSVKGHNYEIYSTLFDRHISWSEKSGIMKKPNYNYGPKKKH